MTSEQSKRIKKVLRRLNKAERALDATYIPDVNKALAEYRDAAADAERLLQEIKTGPHSDAPMTADTSTAAARSTAMETSSTG